MVKHVLLWQLKDEMTDAEKAAAKAKMKKELEALVGVVPGLLSLHVVTEPLETANTDVMLDSTMTDEDALRGYIVHPAHVAAATYVRSVVKSRVCMDYEDKN
ncbi:MAG: Dabb family protein [Clostridia bacterium]|nr:Dabb family protein [Clostridia bacterium]